MRARAAGLVLGFVADRVFGDPRRGHPVAGFGQVATALERRWYADSRGRGLLYCTGLVGAAAAAGLIAERSAPPAARVPLVALATWAVLGGRSLEREALAVHGYLDRGDLPGARRRLTHLVGRDTSELDESEVSRAVIESLAENSSDAVVAPLVWGAVAGVPGLLAYRASNTLDAMVGHHNDRYERFGWASARLDDLVSLPGSRLSGLLTIAAVPGRGKEAWSTWRRDASAHPSPNGGVVESAFAGSLGIRLGGVNQYYGNRVEHRAVMGSGRPARPTDIVRAAEIARRVCYGAAFVCGAVSLVRRRVKLHTSDA
ncbi:cobalamin biosynthesis protein [Aeromicrobium sp. UC242_57]|uniref:cobalamin biosynthesis protein n=1 Tax=Aeromicrobium sp. UC242_57 TaxID=3374624 RepID=UPI0037AC363D